MFTGLIVKSRKIIVLLFLSIIISGRSFSHDKMEYVAEAVEIDPSEAPKIDGKLDDIFWKKGKVLTGFFQREPINGAPATEKSEIYILYDKENLYAGCRFYDLHPENIISELRRREDIFSSDRIELFFDTFHNHRTGYKFAINPYGVQMDEQRYDDNKRNVDWDAIWESGADIDSLGWVAEFKIPFFNMRFPETEEQVWGFNLVRDIRYKAEGVNWKPVSIDDGLVIRMSKLGHLIGIRGITPGRQFELRPYALSGMSETDVVSTQSKNETGFDLKYGITPDATFDVTVNPDYAQVEADVLDINLTRYPTRFPEKRDFFLEGKGIFQTPNHELFYSRRIGVRGDILWGTKLSGRTQGGVEYGFIGSQTGDWDYFGLGSNDESKEEALYGIARVRKGFSNGSSIGVMVTDKESKDDNYNRVFGIDGLFLYKNIYTTQFQVSSSFSPNLSMDNNSYFFNFERKANPLSAIIQLERVEPNYDINGTGFLSKELYRGYQRVQGMFTFNPFIEKSGIRQITVSTSGLIGEDILTKDYITSWQDKYPGIVIKPEYLQGKLNPDNWFFHQSFSIRGTSEMRLGFWYTVGKTNEPTITYHTDEYGLNISSPRTGRIQKISANTDILWGKFFNFSQKYLGSRYNITLNGTSWITSKMGLSLSGQYTKTYDPDKVMDGRHFRISMRNTYLFTKDLFIRLYTQGRWGTTYYGEKSTHNTFLASFLLGWEYHPGSWFYLAYNEGREDVNSPFTPVRDFMMTNRTIIAKLSYAINK